MRPGLPLLAVAFAGCAHYAKLQNPSPIEDLKSSVRLESLAHATLKDQSESRISIRIRIEVPGEATVSINDTVAVLLDDRDSSRAVGYGVVRGDGSAGGTGQIFSSATTARLNVPVRAADGGSLRSGVPYRLRLAWQQRQGAGTDFVPMHSRLYRIRVQKVNFVPMLAIGTVPLAVLLAVLSK